LLSGHATQYLLTIDQLKAPGFTAVEAAHSVSTDTLSAGDSTLASALRTAGVSEAATARWFRDVPELSTSNGPVDVRSTVLRLGGNDAAHTAFQSLVRHTDAVPSMTPVSAGALGDESHADVIESASSGGVRVVEVTVTWRVANLVSVVVLRGRNGGTGLGDALVLAHQQAVGEH
jgi:hypothetical protein